MTPPEAHTGAISSASGGVVRCRRFEPSACITHKSKLPINRTKKRSRYRPARNAGEFSAPEVPRRSKRQYVGRDLPNACAVAGPGRNTVDE